MQVFVGEEHMHQMKTKCKKKKKKIWGRKWAYNVRVWTTSKVILQSWTGMWAGQVDYDCSFFNLEWDS